MEESTATVPKDVPLQPESTASAAQPYYGRPPPSPLSGGYLLIVISEPLTDAHKAVILQKLAKAFLSWNAEDSGIDIERELAIVTALSPEGDFAKNGERLIQNASEHLVTEILIHPQINTMRQCIRNLLSSFTKYRFIIHAGYVFCGNGSWILQDGTFSVSDFIDAFQEIEVQRVIRAYEKTVKIDICCIAEGGWTQSRLQQEPFSKLCQLEINPSDKIAPGNVAVREFVDYLEQYIIPSSIEHLLEPSDIVGNIRFTHPTLYVFPGGEGDAALFGINGFNMLVDGGFGKKACFWNFVRHLDRLDAVLMTRVNNSNIGGMSGVVERKVFSHVYPQVGHFFCNLQGRKQLPSPDGDKDREPLLVNLIEEGDRMVMNLKQLQLKPHHCYRDATSDPINLYHKVGHGKLDMYVISPAKDSREVKEFLSRWNNHDVKLFSGTSKTGSRELRVPLQNLVSICALLVWQPANPDDKITRILFPGSTPQHKIFEGLERLKPLEFLKHSTCTVKSVIPAQTPLVSKPAAKKFVSKLDKQEKILDEWAKSEAQVKSALAGNENETDSGPRSLPVDLQAPTGGAIKSTTTKLKRTVVKSTEKAVMKDIKSKTDQIKEKSSTIDGIVSDKSTADSQSNSGGITKESIVEKKKFERKPVQRPVVAPPPKPKASTPSNEDKKFIESEKSSSPTTPKKSFAEKKSTQVKSTVITGQEKDTESKDQSTTAVTSASAISSTTATVEKESSASVTTSKEQSKVSSTTVTTTTTKLISRPAPRTRTPPKVFPAKSLKDENNRKVAESKPTRTAPTKIIATSKPIKKDEEPTVKAEKKPIVKRTKPPAAPVQNQAVTKPAPAKPSSPVKVTRKPITSRKLNLGDDKKFKPDNERTDSSAVSTPSTLEADTTLLKTKAKSESVKLAKDTSTKSTAIKKIRPKPKPTETQSTKTSTESVTIKPTAPVAEMTTHVSKIITKQGDDEEDEILIIETTEMKPISKYDYDEQKHLRDQIESEKEQKEKDHDVCKSKLEQSLDFAQVNATKKPQVDEKVTVILTPEDKEKIFGEVQGIITTAAEMIATAKPSTDQKSATPAGKPESMPQAKEPVHGSQETSSTTAPTMPEDEKIDFDEPKPQEEIEEKYDKEDTKEKSSENGQRNKIDAKIPLVEQKSEDVILKAKRDIVKTPDEVADLPVHEEVDIPDYDETTEGEDHFISGVTTEEPVIEVVKPEHPEYVTITPTSSPDEKPLPAMTSDTIQKTTLPVEKTAASKEDSTTETKLSKNIIHEAEIISKSSQDATQIKSNLVSDKFTKIDLHSNQLKSLTDTSPHDESSQKDKGKDASPIDIKSASKEISPSTDKKPDVNKLEIGKDNKQHDKSSPPDIDEHSLSIKEAFTKTSSPQSPAELTKLDEKLDQSFRKQSLKSPDEKLKSSETKRSSITDDEKNDQLSCKESLNEFREETPKFSDIKTFLIAENEKIDLLSRKEPLKEFQEMPKSLETIQSSIIEDEDLGHSSQKQSLKEFMEEKPKPFKIKRPSIEDNEKLDQLSRKESLKEFLEETSKPLETKQSSIIEDEDLGHSSRKQSLKEFMEEKQKPSEMKKPSIEDNEKLDHLSRKESLNKFLEEIPKSSSTERFSIAEDEEHGRSSQKQSLLEEIKSSETKQSSIIEDEKLEQSPQKESFKEFSDETSLRKESLKVLQEPSAKPTSPSEDESGSKKVTPSLTKSEETLDQSQRKESLQQVSDEPPLPAGHQVSVDKASPSPTESEKLPEKPDQLQEKESLKGFESKPSLFTIEDFKTTKSPTESEKLDEKQFQSSRKESLKEFLDESSKLPLEKLHSSTEDEPCSDRSLPSPTKSTKSPETPDQLQRKESLKLSSLNIPTEIGKLDEESDLKSSEKLSPSKTEEFLKETLISPEKSDQSQETSKSLKESNPLQRKESLKEFSKFPEKSDQLLRKDSLKEMSQSPEESDPLQRKESLKELSKSPEKSDQPQRAKSPKKTSKSPEESDKLQKKESLKEPLKSLEKSEPLQRKESLEETPEPPEKLSPFQRKESLKEPLKSPETTELSQKNESLQETTTFEISTEIGLKTTNEKSSVEKQQSIDELKSTTVLSSSSFNDATKSARKQSVTFNDESLEIIPSEDLSNDQFTICKSKLRKRSVTDENFLDDEDEQISSKLESPGSEKESQTIYKTTTSMTQSISLEPTDTTSEEVPSFHQEHQLTTTKDSTKLEKSTPKSQSKDFDKSLKEKPSKEVLFQTSESDRKDSLTLTDASKEQKLPLKQASSFEKSPSPSSDITKLPSGENSNKTVEDSTLTEIIKDSAFDAHEIVTMFDKKPTETSITLDSTPETIKDESNFKVAEHDSKNSLNAFEDQPASKDNVKQDDKESSFDETVEKSKIRKEYLPKMTHGEISIAEALHEPIPSKDEITKIDDDNKQDSRKPSLPESFEQSIRKDSLKIHLNDTCEEPILSKDGVTKIEDVTKQDSKRASLTTSPEQSTRKDSLSKTLQESIPLEEEADTKNITTHDTREPSPIKSPEKATRKESLPTTDEKLDLISETITKQESKEKSELEQTIEKSISLKEEIDSTKAKDKELEKLPPDEKLDFSEAAGKQKSNQQTSPTKLLEESSDDRQSDFHQMKGDSKKHITLTKTMTEPISKEQDTLIHSYEKSDSIEVTEEPILTSDTSVLPDERKSSSTVFKQESKEATPTEVSKTSITQEKTGEKELTLTEASENFSGVAKSSLKDDESTSQSLKSPTLAHQSGKTTPEKSLPVDEIPKIESKTQLETLKEKSSTSETKMLSPEKEKLAPSLEKSNEINKVISTQSIEKPEQIKTDTKSKASVGQIKENEKVLDTHTKSQNHSLSEPSSTKDPKDKQQPDHKQSLDLEKASSFENTLDSQGTSKTQVSLNKEFTDSKSKIDTKSSPDSEKIDQPSISSPSLESSLSFEQRTIEEACKSDKSPLDKSSSISDATDARKSSMDTFAWETSPVKIADSKPTDKSDIKEDISITSSKEVIDGSSSEVVSSKDTESDDTTKTYPMASNNVEIKTQKESLDIASTIEPTDSITESRKQSIISDFPEIDPRKESISSQSQKDCIDSDLQPIDLRRLSTSSESRKSSTISDLHQLSFDAIQLSKSPPKDFSVDRKDSLNNSSIQERSNQVEESSYSISQTSKQTSPQPGQSIIKSDSTPTPITRKESLEISPEFRPQSYSLESQISSKISTTDSFELLSKAILKTPSPKDVSDSQSSDMSPKKDDGISAVKEPSESRKSSIVLESSDSRKHNTALEQTSTKESTHISKSFSKESIQSEDTPESLTDKKYTSPDPDTKQVKSESVDIKSPSYDSRKNSLALHSSPITEIEPSSASSHKESSSQKMSPDQSKDTTVSSSTDKKSQEKLPDSFTQSRAMSLDINSKPDSSKLTHTISKEFAGASIDTTYPITQDSPEPSPSKEISSKPPETPVTATQSPSKSPSFSGDAKLDQPTHTSDITKEAADKISPTSQSSLETSPSKDTSPKKPDTDGHSRKESIVLDSKRNSYIFQSRASTESIAGSMDDDFDSRSLPRGSVDIHTSKSFQTTPTEITDLTKRESLTSESRKDSLVDASSTTKTITESTFISSSTKSEDNPKFASKQSSIISDSEQSSIAYEFDKDNVDFLPTTKSSPSEEISPTTKSPSDDANTTSQKLSSIEDSTISVDKQQGSAINITGLRKSSITVESRKPSIQLDQNTDSPRSSVITDSKKSSLQLDQHNVSPITKSIIETSPKEGPESRKSSIQLDTRRSSIAADFRKPSLQLDQHETSVTKTATETSPKESIHSRKSSIQLDESKDTTRSSIVGDSRKPSLQLDEHETLITKPATETSPKEGTESRKSSIQLDESTDTKRSSIVGDSRKPSLQLDEHETLITKSATETSPKEGTESHKSSIQLDTRRSSIAEDSRKPSLQLDEHETLITKPATVTSPKESTDSRKSSIQLDTRRSSFAADSRKPSLQLDEHEAMITKPATETSPKEGTESHKSSIQLDTRRSSIAEDSRKPSLQLDEHETLITKPATETSPKQSTDSLKSSIQLDTRTSSIAADSRKPSLQLDEHEDMITKPATETSPKEGTESHKSSIQLDTRRSSIAEDSRKPSLQLDQHETFITKLATVTSPKESMDSLKSSIQLDESTDTKRSSIVGDSRKPSLQLDEHETLITKSATETSPKEGTESRKSSIQLDTRRSSIAEDSRKPSLQLDEHETLITKPATETSPKQGTDSLKSSIQLDESTDTKRSSIVGDSRKPSLQLDEHETLITKPATETSPKQSTDSRKSSIQLDTRTSSIAADSRKPSLQLDEHEAMITKPATETSPKEGTESHKSSIQLDTRRRSIAEDSRKPSLQLDQHETFITKLATVTSPKESKDSLKSSIQLDESTDTKRSSIVGDSRKPSLQLDEHETLITESATETSPKEGTESRKSSIQLDTRRSSIAEDSRKPSLQLDEHETLITKPATETSPKQSTDSRKSSIQLDTRTSSIAADSRKPSLQLDEHEAMITKPATETSPKEGTESHKSSIQLDTRRSSIAEDLRKPSLQLDEHETFITKLATVTSPKESMDSLKSSIQLDESTDTKRSSIVGDSRKPSLQLDEHETLITESATETSPKEGTESRKSSIQIDTRSSIVRNSRKPSLQLDEHETLITKLATVSSPKESTDSLKSSIQLDESTDTKRSSIVGDSRKPSLQLDEHETLITKSATETSQKEGTESRKSSIQLDTRRSSIATDSKKPSLQLDEHGTLITTPATDTSPNKEVEFSKSSVQLDNNTDLRKSSLQLHQQGRPSITEPISEISSPKEGTESHKSSFTDSKQKSLLTQTNQENQKIFTTESQQSTISESYLDQRKDSFTCNWKEETPKTSSDPLIISQTKLATDSSLKKISTTSILEPALESSLAKEQIISDSRKSSLAADSRKASLGLDLERVTSSTVDTFSETELVITSTNDDTQFRKTSLPSDFGKTIDSVKLEKPTTDLSSQKQKDIEVLSSALTSTVTESTTTTLAKPQESKTIHIISESTHADLISESKHKSPNYDKNYSEIETSPSQQTIITDSRKSSTADSRTGSIFTKSGEILDSKEPSIDIPIGSFTIESTTSEISAKESKQISSSKHSSTIDTITSEKTINPDQITLISSSTVSPFAKDPVSTGTDSSKSSSTLSESHKTSQSAESASHIVDSLTETTSEFITQSRTSTSGSDTISSTASSTISKFSTDEGSLKDKIEIETFMTEMSKDDKASEFTSTDVLTTVSSIPTVEKDVKSAITSSAVDTNTTLHKTFTTSGQTKQFSSSVTSSTDNQTSSTEKSTIDIDSTPTSVTVSSSKQQIIVSESQVADTSTKQNIDELEKKVNTYQTGTETGKLSSHQLGSVSTLGTCNIDLSHRSPSPDFHSHKSATYTFTTIGSPDGNGPLTETTPRQDLGYVEQLDVTQSNLKSSITTEQTIKLQDNNDTTTTQSQKSNTTSKTSELVSGDSEKSTTTTTTTQIVSSQSPLKTTTLEGPITETTSTAHVETFSEIDPSSVDLAQFTSFSSADLPHPGVSTADGRYSTIEYQTITKYVVIPSADGSPSRIRKYTTEIIPTSVREMSRAEYEKLDDVRATSDAQQEPSKPALREMDSKSYDSFTQFHPTSTAFTTVKHDAVTKSISEPKILISPDSGALHMDANQMRVQFLADSSASGTTSVTKKSATGAVISKSSSDETYDATASDTLSDLSSNKFHKKEVVSKTVSLPILDEVAKPGGGSIGLTDPSEDISRSLTCLEKIAYTEGTKQTISSDPSSLNKQPGEGELQLKSASLPVIKRPDDSEKYMTLPNLYKTTNLEDLTAEDTIIEEKVISSETPSSVKVDSTSGLIAPIKETDELTEDDNQPTLLKKVIETTTKITSHLVGALQPDSNSPQRSQTPCSEDRESDDNRSDISLEQCSRITQHSGGAGRDSSQICESDEDDEFVESMNTQSNLPHFKENDPIQHPLSTSEMETMRTMSSSMTQSFYGTYPEDDDDELPEDSRGSCMSTSVHHSTQDSAKDDKKDPIKDWGRPLGLPNVKNIDKLLIWNPIEEWGRPFGLPTPAPPPPSVQERESNGDIEINLAPINRPTNNVTKGTPTKKVSKKPTVAEKMNTARETSKTRDSSIKRAKPTKPTSPIYVDLAYVPHHGNPYYTTVEFFKRIRARYYVFSGTDPSKDVFNALIDAKKTWEDQNLEVTIIPTYDTDVLGYWITENEETLLNLKIDLSPSASRCTINLQDHDTSCSAYRLEF